jgi:hypothetical protein
MRFMSHREILGRLIAIVIAISNIDVAEAQNSVPAGMPECYDPRSATCTARIAPCWSDYEVVKKACKNGTCSLALVARVTADWNRALMTCTHTGLP